MVKVINVNKIGDELIFYRGQFNNNLIFIQLNKESGREPDNCIMYSSLIKCNQISDHIEYFPVKATEISRTDTFPVLYNGCGTIDSCGNSAIQFSRINCNDFSTDTEIITFPLTRPQDSPAPTYFEIYGISERYALAFIPRSSPEYGSPMFSEMLLWDSRENVFYHVPDRIGKSDSLLRIRNIMISRDNSRAYIALITGRINWDEKEEFWQYSRKPYFDQLQNLLISDVHTFVDAIKAGNEMGAGNIIDSCGFESAFTFFAMDGKQLRYAKATFPDKTSELISYDLVSKERLQTKIDGFYSRFFFSDRAIYGIERGAPGAIVYDVMNREVVFTAAANELIEYFDDECAVTRIWQSGNKHPFFLHYYDDNKFEKVGEGRYCSFDKERGLLMIFK